MDKQSGESKRGTSDGRKVSRKWRNWYQNEVGEERMRLMKKYRELIPETR